MKASIISFIAFAFIVSACSKADKATSVSETGKGGSLAKFTIAGNFLYIVDGFAMHVYNIENPVSMRAEPDVYIGFVAETIFPYNDKLFIGSRDGMFIYSLANPSNPEKLGEARHLRSCDPVVANDTVSYVTLRGGSPCGPAEDGLYIYDIKNVHAPVIRAVLPMQQPSGLGLKDSVVFVCQEDLGLTAVNVKEYDNPKIMYTLTNATYKDVIVYGELLICYTSTGLILYNISDLKHISQESAIAF